MRNFLSNPRPTLADLFKQAHEKEQAAIAAAAAIRKNQSLAQEASEAERHAVRAFLQTALSHFTDCLVRQRPLSELPLAIGAHTPNGPKHEVAAEAMTGTSPEPHKALSRYAHAHFDAWHSFCQELQKGGMGPVWTQRQLEESDQFYWELTIDLLV